MLLSVCTDQDEHFINLFEENDHKIIHETAGKDSVQWVIKVDAHPSPILEWQEQSSL